MSATITSEQVMNLRNQTGAGIMDCKVALKESDGDINKAVEILRKKGIAGLAKRAGRTMKEGLIISKTSNNKTALLEINCETDFVAKNPDVKKFAEDLIDLMLKDFSYSIPQENEKAKESLQNIAMKTGENMAIRRGIVYETNNNSVVGVYIHSDSKKAAIVELSYEKGDKSLLENIAKDIAMQCVAMGAKWVKREDVSNDIIEKEKEIYKATPQAQGKSEIALSKMLEGRIKKFYEENCLLEQAFIKDSKLTISSLIKNKSNEFGNIEIKRFVTFLVGVE